MQFPRRYLLPLRKNYKIYGNDQAVTGKWQLAFVAIQRSNIYEKTKCSGDRSHIV